MIAAMIHRVVQKGVPEMSDILMNFPARPIVGDTLVIMSQTVTIVQILWTPLHPDYDMYAVVQ